jgi:hypothetical protein
MKEYEKPTQCCICKSNTTDMPWVTKYFNLEEGKSTIIANGCENCRNYAEVTKRDLETAE